MILRISATPMFLATILILARLATAPASGASRDDWATCADTANVAFDSGIMACSTILGDRALSKNNRAMALSNRCMMWVFKQDADRALADCNQAISLNPKLASAYVARGGAWLCKSEIDRAIADYTKAIALDPNEYGGYDNRSRIYRGRGNLDDALVDLSQSIRINPNRPYPYRERGVIRLSKGDFASAAEDLGRAVELSANNAATDYNYPYIAIYRFLARARLGEDAVPELRTNVSQIAHRHWPYPVIEMYLGGRPPADVLAAASTPSDRCEGEFYVGEFHLVHGDRDQAQQHLKAAVDTCPTTFGEYLIASAEVSRLNR